MGSRYSMTLKRERSGAFKDRIRLPQDVRLEYQAQYGPAWEEKFYRSADTPPEKARADHAAWVALVRNRIAALRGKGGKGIDLTQQQADILAGDWYRWFTSQHLDNPGSPNGYEAIHFHLWSMAVEAGDPERGEPDFDDPEVLSEVNTLARASQFLTDRGIALTQAGRTRFLSALVREFLAAIEVLERRARGGWGPDQHLEELAPPSALASLAATGGADTAATATAFSLFAAYVKATKRAPATRKRPCRERPGVGA